MGLFTNKIRVYFSFLQNKSHYRLTSIHSHRMTISLKRRDRFLLSESTPGPAGIQVVPVPMAVFPIYG